MRFLFFIIINFIVVTNTNAFSDLSENEEVFLCDKIVDAIRKKDFSEVRLEIKKLPPGQIKSLLNTIYNYNFYKENVDSLYVNFSDSLFSKTDDYLNVLLLLTKGYQKLYYYPSNYESVQFFRRALILAEEINNVALMKLSIISILKYYLSGTYTPNENFRKYIQQYKKLPQDQFDSFLLFYYEFQLDSSDARKNFNSYYSVLKDLQIILDTLDRNNGFYLTLLKEEAYIYELEADNQNDSIDHSVALKKLIDIESLFNDSTYVNNELFIVKCKIAYNKSKVGELKDVEKYLKEAERLINPYKKNSNQKLLHYYYEYYELAKNNYKGAYHHLLQYVLKDKITRHYENAIQANIHRVELDDEKKVAMLKKQEAALIQNRNYLIAAGVLAILLLFIIIQYIRNSKKEKLLYEQSLKLAEQQKELEAIDAMIAGKEAERQEVASELHDELGSLMATTKLHLNASEGKESESFKRGMEFLDITYQKIRNISHLKEASVLKGDNLVQSIEGLISNIESSRVFEIYFNHFDIPEKLDQNISLFLFRTNQEILTNIIKHAKASEVNITMSYEQEALSLTIEDDGIGMDTQIITQKSGIGLSSIKTKALHFGGSFTIDSQKGQGTTLMIQIPI